MLALALNGTQAVWASRAPRAYAQPDVAVIALNGSDWNAVGEAFAQSAHPAVLIGIDTPHLPLNRLRDAFTRLEDGADLVIGPAEDGSPYLIGIKAALPGFFDAMPHDHNHSMRALQQRVGEAGLRLTRLPGWYRINGYDDLHRLNEDLRVMPHDVAVHTRAFLNAGLDQAQVVGG
ncbi:DUF2064 domain-containing protein [Candidatus Gracilibacteria bacterium]|nr:DUF2064 domain-containing protein [Candidatus Gracilibacteria bacterium]